MPNLPTKECTGCSACAMLCPVAAITMTENSEGFLQPKVEESKCIHCGRCESFCVAKQEITADGTPEHGIFAAKVRDETEHRKSQSGGAFYALAYDMLKNNGAVYGAALNEKFETEHIRVDDLTQLHKLQGVKYVQSRLGNTFSQVGDDLRNNVKVLFSGTPCQVAGLYSFLAGKKIPTDKLLTCDLVCYGVPSPGVFREWIKCLEKSKNARVVDMCYRRTDEKWGKGRERYSFSNDEILEGAYFTGLYFRDLILRDSCTQCHYCNMNRVGDITLGDFWGIENEMPDVYDDRGISLVMCSTEKGSAALACASERLILAKSHPEAAAAAQPRLQGIAAKHSSYRDKFWKTYRTRGMEYIAIEEGFIPVTVRYKMRKKWESIKQRLRMRG